jgi:hypothetical protein
MPRRNRNDDLSDEEIRQLEERFARQREETFDLMERIGRGETVLCEKCGTPISVYPPGDGPYDGLSCAKRCTYAHFHTG